MPRLPFIDTSFETKSRLFNETSPVTNSFSFKYVIPSTLRVPLSTMFLPTDKLPLSDESRETKSRLFNEASPITNTLLFNVVIPSTNNVPRLTMEVPTNKLPFMDKSDATVRALSTTTLPAKRSKIIPNETSERSTRVFVTI